VLCGGGGDAYLVVSDVEGLPWGAFELEWGEGPGEVGGEFELHEGAVCRADEEDGVDLLPGARRGV